MLVLGGSGGLIWWVAKDDEPDKDKDKVVKVDPKKEKVEFTWRDNSPTAGKTSYYYIRGEQENGELVWVSPMWITYTGK